MLVDETVYSLEMNSRDDLIAGRPAPHPVHLTAAASDEWALLSEIFIRIGDGVGEGFQTRRIPPWTEAEWRERLETPGSQSYLIRANDDIIGYLDIQEMKENVEIVVFGLVPEYVGKGYGGEALTRSVEVAWSNPQTERVWLHTSTRDHPHALSNYHARGFKTFLEERKQREVALKWNG